MFGRHPGSGVGSVRGRVAGRFQERGEGGCPGVLFEYNVTSRTRVNNIKIILRQGRTRFGTHVQYAHKLTLHVVFE